MQSDGLHWWFGVYIYIVSQAIHCPTLIIISLFELDNASQPEDHRLAFNKKQKRMATLLEEEQQPVGT